MYIIPPGKSRWFYAIICILQEIYGLESIQSSILIRGKGDEPGTLDTRNRPMLRPGKKPGVFLEQIADFIGKIKMQKRSWQNLHLQGE